MRYDIEQNMLNVKQQQLLKPDKFFFNNQNIIDKDSNFLYSMGRDFIHKISLDKLSCYIPDVGYVEYYSQWEIRNEDLIMNWIVSRNLIASCSSGFFVIWLWISKIKVTLVLVYTKYVDNLLKQVLVL